MPIERRIPAATLGEPRIDSPLQLEDTAGGPKGQFVPEGTWVRNRVEVNPHDDPDAEEILFEKAGPRSKIFFDPTTVRAAVVTCGGLCPGLNNVIRSLTLELHFNYRVAEVLGLRNGYMGLNPEIGPRPITLTPDVVSRIHTEGGTMLGTSRGPQDVGLMAEFLRRERIDMLFTIGGDGTQRGAHALAEELRRRGQNTALIGIPKTIDNDIVYCSRTFGFFSAVEEAQRVIHLAHTEAKGAYRGIGLVKVMGRHAGFIACMATLANQDVNYTLIPEVTFDLHGPGGLLEHLESRMEAKGHAVILVAEGAGQHLFESDDLGRDASGNKRLHDIGPYLKYQIVDHFHSLGRPVDLKYIDPSYIIRSVPANTDDSILCDQYARRAVHAAMAGKTDLIISFLNQNFVHVPIAMATSGSRRVNLDGETWTSVLAATGQPPRFGA
jgi:6-phosphofructokinase 1